MLEHEELDAIADEVDDLHEAHREREPRDGAADPVEDAHLRRRQPEVTRRGEREDAREHVCGRPHADGRVDAPAEPDDHDQHPSQRQQRRQDLDHVPETDARAAEQDPGETRADHVRQERGCRDCRESQAERVNDDTGEEDHSGAPDSEHECPDKCARGKRPELFVARQAGHRDTELSEQPREDRHRQNHEDETAASIRVEEAALDHDERERNGRRDAAEEQCLERVPSDATGARDRAPRIVRRDRRDGVAAGRRPHRAGRGKRPARHAGETTLVVL